MAVTERIVHFIGGHEGKVLTAYLDPAHVLTIGYGFTWSSATFRDWWTARRGRKLQRGDTMTEAEANEVFRIMLDGEYAPPVRLKFGAVASNIIEAGLSAVYNLGTGALSWKWAAAVVGGDLHGAAALWRTMGTTAKGKKLPGLVRRRAEEADIAEKNVWPKWLVDKWPGIEAAPDGAPETHVDHVDIRQAQVWLGRLGYPCGESDGIAGPRTKAAAARFQKDHGTLRVDGIIGVATLAALQRAIDLKDKAGKVAAGGTVATGAGAADQATGTTDAIPDVSGVDPGWIGDVLLWGGIAVLVIGLGYLAWRYRDELNAFVRKL